MNNLDRYVHEFREDVGESGPLVWPEDVAAIRAAIKEMNNISEQEVEHLWLTYSDEVFMATWIRVVPHSLQRFQQWLGECGTDS